MKQPQLAIDAVGTTIGDLMASLPTVRDSIQGCATLMETFLEVLLQ